MQPFCCNNYTLWVDFDNNSVFTDEELHDNGTETILFNQTNVISEFYKDLIGLTLEENKEIIISSNTYEENSQIDILANDSISGVFARELRNYSLKFHLSINKINNISITNLSTTSLLNPPPSTNRDDDSSTESIVNSTTSIDSPEDSSTNTSQQDQIDGNEIYNPTSFISGYPIGSAACLVLIWITLKYHALRKKILVEI